MVAFILILAFPLLSGLGYGLFHLGHRVVMAGKPGQTTQRYVMLVYAAMLSIPLMAVYGVLATSFPHFTMGFQWPVFGGLPLWVSLPLATLLAIGVGYLFYQGEVWIRKPTLPAIGARNDLQYLADGHTEEMIRHTQQLPIGLLLPTMVFVVLAEEVLWRGFLIEYAHEAFALHWGTALLISSVSFGINHYYFGLRNVLTKLLLGGLWGSLMLATGSLFIPILSHLTFNVLALNLKIEWER